MMPGMMGARMMDSMQAQMRSMDAMSPERLKTMVPMHRQMVANMLAQMNQEMRSMNMTASPAWSALVDSVRSDLIHMPEMSGTELRSLISAHHGRVTRLMQMHQQMIGGMKR